METVNNIENTIIINKSKFITNLIYIEDINDIEKHLNLIKKKYKDATHHCYAYIINNIKRFNDDFEPNGTAGMPILKCLEKNNLNYILCIVTRYFGGIKLGAGGLVRAYTNSVTEALYKTRKLKLINGYLIEINFNYDKTDYIDKILNEINVINKTFNELVTYTIECDDDILNILKELDINVTILKNLTIKKNN